MMFDAFSPTIGEDYRYPIAEVTPAQMLREHSHEDVEDGIKQFSHNYEILATNTEGYRHSSRLFLVDDEHYIICSRSGLESSGNVLYFSNSSPETLRFSVIQEVFSSVAQNQFGDIKNGDTAHKSEPIAVVTPKQFVLQQKLSEKELTEYYDTIADYTYDLIESFNTVETVSDIEEIIEEYNTQLQEAYRDAIDFEPTTVYEIFSSKTFDDSNWQLPTDVDKDTSFELCMSDTPNNEFTLFIEVTEGLSGDEVYLFAQSDADFDTEYTLFEYEYDSIADAVWAIELCLSVTPDMVMIRDGM